IAASMPLTFCGIAAVTLLRSIQSSPYTPRMSLWTTGKSKYGTYYNNSRLK
ncbi:hypothetical protein L9F63_027650, partial [Diploptera punctata]